MNAKLRGIMDRLSVVSAKKLAGYSTAMKCHCVIAVLALLPACGSPPRVETPTDRYGLNKEPQVYIVHRISHGFQLDSTGQRTGRFILGPGPIGSLAESQRKNESASLEEKLGLEDPVAFGKERLAQALRLRWGLTNVRVLPDAWDGKLNEFKKTYPTGILILLRTGWWGMDNYRARYTATARVVKLDASSRSRQNVTCPSTYVALLDAKKSNPQTDDDVTAVMDSILADQAAVLKAGLRKAGEQCADRIADRMMGIARQANQEEIKEEELEDQ